MYGKGKKQSRNQRKTSKWKDVSKKEIESFLGLVILMGINDLPNRKLYWSKDMLFHQTFISSIMSRVGMHQIQIQSNPNPILCLDLTGFDWVWIWV